MNKILSIYPQNNFSKNMNISHTSNTFSFTGRIVSNIRLPEEKQISESVFLLIKLIATKTERIAKKYNLGLDKEKINQMVLNWVELPDELFNKIKSTQNNYAISTYRKYLTGLPALWKNSEYSQKAILENKQKYIEIIKNILK